MSKTMEPYLMSVLSSRLYSIGLEMTNTLMRTARSQLMSVCHDLSTAICDRNGKVIALAESIPVHCANMGLTVSPCFSHPDGIQQGDLFLNNSPYHGNTHHADYTYIAPVFNEGELMFFAVTKGHQADIGNAIPSTYAPTARDMFEEGAIDWPCIKIQRDYKDVADIIKIAQMHNRVPEMWYGDYLACVGSSRVGEKRLAALCAEYGNEKIKEFCEAYQAYQAYGARSSSSCRRAITSTTSRRMPSRASCRRSRSTLSAIRIPRMGRSRLISRKTRTRCPAASTCARRRRSRAR